MKIKPVYIYSFIIIAAIAFLVYTSKSNVSNPPTSNTGDNVHGNMPNDDIHKGLAGSQNPSKGNVSENVKHMMEMMGKAYEENPNDTLKAREYADFLTAAHQQEKAIPIYEKILQKNPKRTDINFSLAYIYFMKQDFNKSEQLIDKVLSYDKDNVHALFNKGLVLVTRGEKEKGKAVWEKLVSAYPNSEIAMKTRDALKELK